MMIKATVAAEYVDSIQSLIAGGEIQRHENLGLGKVIKIAQDDILQMNGIDPFKKVQGPNNTIKGFEVVKAHYKHIARMARDNANRREEDSTRDTWLKKAFHFENMVREMDGMISDAKFDEAYADVDKEGKWML